MVLQMIGRIVAAWLPIDVTQPPIIESGGTGRLSAIVPQSTSREPVTRGKIRNSPAPKGSLEFLGPKYRWNL